MTLNQSSPRYQHSAVELQKVGIKVEVHDGIRLGTTKGNSYRGGTLAQLGVWDRIWNDPNTARNEFSLVVEDDISLVAIDTSVVLDLLSCTAWLSMQLNLPFLYAGACLGPNSRVFGKPRLVPMPRNGRTVHIVRANAACAHAYAVRRSAVPWLRNATAAHLWPRVAWEAMDGARIAASIRIVPSLHVHPP